MDYIYMYIFNFRSLLLVRPMYMFLWFLFASKYSNIFIASLTITGHLHTHPHHLTQALPFFLQLELSQLFLRHLFISVLKPNFLCVGAAAAKQTVKRNDIVALASGMMNSLILYNLWWLCYRWVIIMHVTMNVQIKWFLKSSRISLS